ncbi:hypothetical protein FYZ34_11695, partial [Mobiluncus mulieris]|nr:hypothetical protein [Mobiluncus mulieris]
MPESNNLSILNETQSNGTPASSSSFTPCRSHGVGEFSNSDTIRESDAHNESSSSVDNGNVQSQSTGEETPVTGESSGESGGET